MKKVIFLILSFLLLSKISWCEEKIENCNYRFYFGWGFQSNFSANIPEKDFRFQEYHLSQYLGDWLAYGYSLEGVDFWLVTQTQLDLVSQSLLLKEMWNLQHQKQKGNYHLGMERRLWKNFWLKLAYQQFSCLLWSNKNEESLLVDYQELIDTSSDFPPYYFYHFIMKRQFIFRTTREDYRGRNCHIFLKYERKNKKLTGAIGGGIDLWLIKYQSTTSEYLIFQKPFSPSQIFQSKRKFEKRKLEYYFRPIIFFGDYLHVYKNCHIGFEAKIPFGKKSFPSGAKVDRDTEIVMFLMFQF